MTTQDKLEFVDRYLRQELSEDELVRFNELINTDAEAKKLLNEQKELHKAINRHFFKDDLDQIHKDLPKQISKPKKNNIRHLYFYYAAAAVVVIFIAVAGFWNTKNSSSLYNDYFYKDAGLPVVMSSQNTTLSETMNLYKQDKFKEAATDFTTLLEQQPHNDTLLYYLAMSKLNLKKNQEAKALLQNVKTGTLYDNSQYFLALIAIKKEEWQQAAQHLKNSNHPKAKELLEKIKP